MHNAACLEGGGGQSAQQACVLHCFPFISDASALISSPMKCMLYARSGLSKRRAHPYGPCGRPRAAREGGGQREAAHKGLGPTPNATAAMLDAATLWLARLRGTPPLRPVAPPPCCLPLLLRCCALR